MKNIFIPLAFAINIVLTLYGFSVLLDSPYTGLRMSVCGDHACVKSVDRDSPAYGKIQPGDRVVDVNGLNLSPLVFHEDPDYIRLERDFSVFWESEYKLNNTVVKGRQTELSMERDGQASTVSLAPVYFPFSQALFRTAPIYIVGWTFLIVAYLVYRKKINEASRGFLLLGVFVCIDWVVGAPFTVRDISFHYPAFRLLNSADFISALLLVCSFLHMALVFPKRILPPKLHSFTVAGLYIFALLLMVLRFMNFFDNTYFTTYFAFSVSLIAVIILFIAQYYTEKNTVVRRQIKWVVLCTLISSTIYGGLSSLPVMLGAQFISVALSGLGFILIPLSFAFAITRYRLMEIENLLDSAVIYGFTILVLAGVETAFLGFTSPYLLANGAGLPYFSVIAVLLIVFIYVPVRNFMKVLVERLFRRGRYDVEKEVRQFTVKLGLCDEQSALDKFIFFVKGLIGPSGVIVLKIGSAGASVLSADNEAARSQAQGILSQADTAWEYVRVKGACAFGYEFLEKSLPDKPSFSHEFENVLFVPFITDPAGTRNGYLAVLLKKWNETAYSVKDVALLNAVSANIAGLIESGELRKERDAITERFQREKDVIMKELHDGLGNLLTSVIVTSQAAERICEDCSPKAQRMVQRIEELSSDAVEFMRTGLTVLDNPHGDLVTIMESVKNRFICMFEAIGIELAIDCSDEAGRVRPGAVVVLNITRIIQEAFGNIIKHADATQARMRFDRSGARLTLTISDNGKGFSAGESGSGFGLKNMQRRIDSIKGSMDVVSSPGKGVELRFTAPLAVD